MIKIANVDERSLRALALLLLLVQLPHLLNLPVWVSALGASIVGARLLVYYKPLSTVLRILLSPIALTLLAVISAALIKWHFGYFLGRDPCVAFLFLLVACKFAEIRRSQDATLLLCLAAFLLLTQYFYAQTILSALITLPAVLALGHALAVLRDPDNARAAALNIKLVVKMLLQGAPLAGLLFIVFPRLPGPLWSLPDDAVAKTGLSDSMQPGSISELSLSDAVAFRVEFEGKLPAASQRYWRGPVLTHYDGQSWSTGPHLIQANPPQTVGVPLHYSVMLQPHQQRWMFALDMPASLPSSVGSTSATQRTLAHMTSSGELLSRKPITKITHYQQTSLLVSRYQSQRRPSIETLKLPTNNPQTATFARQLQSQYPAPTDFVNALLSWFNEENFHYTLKPSLLGDSQVDEFLFGTRQGFCEHYASAFVVLMRAANIPARVVTGYLGGEMNGDYMIVRQSDAHAWAEAFIDGHWTRFDPTAAVAPSRVEHGMAAALPADEPIPRLARINSDWLKRVQLGWDAVNHDWQRLIVNFDNNSQAQLWQRLGLPEPKLWLLTSVVLLITAVWSLFVLGFPKGRKPSTAPAERVWRELCGLLASKGIKRQLPESPQYYIDRAACALPDNAANLLAIGETLTRLRFESVNQLEYESALKQLRKEIRYLKFSMIVQRRPLTRSSLSRSLQINYK